ncbi:hypothetical protein DPMN_074135 [Dreissena polymorpha]|uniref:Uncharacterized protein n=1 Tax=Dreissena polymorpha TaxID=45954 RepID=A0A9D4BLC9_DREPO|nr:hypothetical protein DPMN_074135 [Dreissena polymorpha]
MTQCSCWVTGKITDQALLGSLKLRDIEYPVPTTRPYWLVISSRYMTFPHDATGSSQSLLMLLPEETDLLEVLQCTRAMACTHISRQIIKLFPIGIKIE